MTQTRKAIFDALFARLQTVPGIVTCERRLRIFDQVQPSEQPALFVQPGNEIPERVPGLPVKWIMQVELYLYVHDTSAAGPSEKLHETIDGIEQALRATTAEARGQDLPTTLGGLVTACHVSGIETDSGVLGDQAVAIVSLEIVVS